MEQKEIRKWNNEQYSAVEGAGLIEELDARTKSELEGYNSIAELGEKVKDLEETGGTPGEPGADGLSAYEIAVSEGFIGTEAQWLESLKGNDGSPGTPGSPGSPGGPGSDGDSAFQIAVSEGFEGTESQWLESLKGEPGEPGADGQDGTTDISPKWVEVTANRDLLPTDIGKILYNRGATDVVITIPNDAALGITEDVSFTAWHEGVGKVRFKGDTGVTANPIQTVGTTLIEPLSYMRRGTNYWLGVKGEVWEEYGPNIYQVGNALSVPDYEANSITGITDITEWKATSVTTDPIPYEGDYCMLFTHGGPDNTGYVAKLGLSGLEIGASYRIGLWIYRVTSALTGGGEIAPRIADGWTTNNPIATMDSSFPVNEWVYREGIKVATSVSPKISIVASSNADTGMSYAIKSLVIKKIN